MVRIALVFLAAVLATAAPGSIVQTQFNLAALAALEVPIPLDIRLRTTGQDLLGFGPAMLALTGAAFVAAFPVASLLARFVPQWRTGWYVLAGGAAILSALLIMEVVLPITPIAAARTLSGVSGLMLAGMLGGWVFARLSS